MTPSALQGSTLNAGEYSPKTRRLSLATPQQRGNLKYVLRMNIENKDSIAIIAAAMKNTGVKSGIPPQYPGTTFSYAKTSNPLSSKKKTNAAFQALVG